MGDNHAGGRRAVAGGLLAAVLSGTRGTLRSTRAEPSGGVLRGGSALRACGTGCLCCLQAGSVLCLSADAQQPRELMERVGGTLLPSCGSPARSRWRTRKPDSSSPLLTCSCSGWSSSFCYLLVYTLTGRSLALMTDRVRTTKMCHLVQCRIENEIFKGRKAQEHNATTVNAQTSR